MGGTRARGLRPSTLGCDRGISWDCAAMASRAWLSVRALVTQKSALLDDGRDLGRDHFLPRRVARLELREGIAGKDRKALLVDVLQAFNETILEQIGVEV